MTAAALPRVLVTGSSGLIGRAVAAALSGRWHVEGVDVLPGRWTTAVADIAAPGLERLVRGMTAIVHVAALHAPHVDVRSDEDFVRTNVTATERLLELARASGVGRFAFASTTSVYGRSLEAHSAAVWVDEALPCRPRDVYDETKLAAEAMVAAADGPGLRTATLRVARCFTEPTQVMAVHRLHRGVDVLDVADAFALAVERDLAAHVVANVAGPMVFEPADCADLWQSARAVIDARVPWLRAAFERRAWQLPDRLDRVYDSRRAAAALGYAPRFGVEAVLAEPGHRQSASSWKATMAENATAPADSAVRRETVSSASGTSSAATIQTIAPRTPLQAAAVGTRTFRGTSTRLIARPSGMLCTAIAAVMKTPSASPPP
jgi:nucleoside-diphosphate-sugar epimerase